MATKSSGELPFGSSYSLGEYSFRLERRPVSGSTNDQIDAICTQGGKNARKSIQIPSSAKIESWSVEANDTTADVYVTIKDSGGIDDWTASYTIDAAGTGLGSNGISTSYNYVKANNGKAIAVWNQRSGNNGLPYLYSKSSSAAAITPGAMRSQTSSAGEVWYFGTGLGEQGPGSNSAGLPVVSYPVDPPIDTILAMAGYQKDEEIDTLLVGRFKIDLGDAGGEGPGSDWDDYGCGGDGGNGGGGGGGAASVVVFKFATSHADHKDITVKAKRHGYGSGGGKGGKGGAGCILIYY